VVFTVRSVEKGHAAARGTSGRTEVRALDLASLDSVREFTAGWKGPVDLLINNAAAPTPPKPRRTADGFELQFGTDHLGHFALTSLLLQHIPGRVVTVSSLAQRMGRIDLTDLNLESRGYTGQRAYAQAKLANLLFSAELQRRLEVAGSGVRAQAAHPGLVTTNIYRESGRISQVVARRMGQSPEQGALPVLYAAVADIPGNSFAGPSRLMHMRGAPQLIGRSSTAQDAGLALRLWTSTARILDLVADLRFRLHPWRGAG
jgi:NAD(P)-dependent dehydrogenase (short-subunit alcohol dehydrogenase family)